MIQEIEDIQGGQLPKSGLVDPRPNPKAMRGHHPQDRRTHCDRVAWVVEAALKLLSSTWTGKTVGALGPKSWD